MTLIQHFIQLFCQCELSRSIPGSIRSG